MANELVIPPDIKPESGELITLLDDQTVSFRPQFGRAWSQRNSFGDPRWRLKRTYRALRMSDRARMMSTVQEARGGFRTIMLAPAQEPRGVWSGSETLTNSDFSSGLTGWTSGSQISRSVSDAVYRATRNANTTTMSLIQQSANVAVTAYQPYALRLGLLLKKYPVSLLLNVQDNGAVSFASQTATADAGYQILAFTPFSTPIIPRLIDNTSSGLIHGDYVDINFASMAPCFLIDGGGNTHLQSDAIENAAWTPTGLTSRTANTSVAPDGTTTADTMLENSSNSNHDVSQIAARSSAIADLCAYGWFKRGTGTRNVRLTAGNNGTDFGSAVFDLGAGTAGTPANNGTATNARAFIVSAGDGWYFCCVVARLTAAAVMTTFAQMANGTSTSYTGDGTSTLLTWGVGMQLSSVPTRGSHTTSAAVSASSQSGSEVYVKGLPVSQDGLLVAGDWVEIDGQLKQLTAALNSNAAGLGVLRVRPQIARAVADNTPVVVTKPMGRFVLGESTEWAAKYGLYTDFDLTFDEVYE